MRRGHGVGAVEFQLLHIGFYFKVKLVQFCKYLIAMGEFDGICAAVAFVCLCLYALAFCVKRRDCSDDGRKSVPMSFFHTSFSLQSNIELSAHNMFSYCCCCCCSWCRLSCVIRLFCQWLFSFCHRFFLVSFFLIREVLHSRCQIRTRSQKRLDASVCRTIRH